MEEICTYLGRSSQPNCDVCIFFHHRKHSDINVLNQGLGEIYNSMLHNSNIDRNDSVLIYSFRDDHIQPISVTHMNYPAIIYSIDVLQITLFKLLSADRSKDNSFYIEKLTFADNDRLLKCESYNIDKDDNIINVLNRMSFGVMNVKINEVIEYKSRK